MKEPSEIKKVFLFLGVLLALLIGSFFVGMYLGTESTDEPASLTPQIPPRDTSSPVPVKADSSVPGPSFSETSLSKPALPSGGQEAPRTTDVPSGYTVQVGAYKDAKKAGEVAAQLRRKGYDASVVSATSPRGEPLHKIRVGQFRDRAEAEVLARAVRNELEPGSEPFVTPR